MELLGSRVADQVPRVRKAVQAGLLGLGCGWIWILRKHPGILRAMISYETWGTLALNNAKS